MGLTTPSCLSLSHTHTHDDHDHDQTFEVGLDGLIVPPDGETRLLSTKKKIILYSMMSWPCHAINPRWRGERERIDKD